MGMQEKIWDKGSTELAEECGSFVAEGILAFQGLCCVDLVAPYRKSSHVLFCRMYVLMWSPAQRSRGCRIVYRSSSEQTLQTLHAKKKKRPSFEYSPSFLCFMTFINGSDHVTSK